MAVKNDVQSLTVFIEGKISAHRYQDGKYYTTIVCPSPDPYSQPSVVETRSVGQLGADGTVVKVSCKLGGFMGRPFEVVDKMTGAKRQARNVVLTLDVIV